MQTQTPLQNCLKLLCALMLIALNINLKAQNLTDAEIKTALVYNFLKYTESAHFDTISTIHLGAYGDDKALLESLKKLEHEKIKGKNIKVVQLQKPIDLKHIDALFLFNENNFELSRINKLANNKSLLLITDRAEDKKLVMINFIHQNNTIQFEINSKNLNENGFYSNPKLLVLGGTELDVRKLYKEAEESLRSEQERTRVIELELNEKQAEVNKLTSELHQLYTKLDSLNATIRLQIANISIQQDNLDSISTELISRQIESSEKGKTLDSINNNLLSKNKQIRILDISLSEKQEVLKNAEKNLFELRNEIILKEKVLDEQENQLKEQSNTIETQNTRLLITSAFILVLLILVSVIYSNFKAKKKRSIVLEESNRKINQQNEQIAFQAEELTLKNRELQRLSIVAEKTNNAVIIMNANGQIEWANEGFEKQHEYKLYEYIELNGKNFIDISTYKEAKKLLHNCRKQKTPATYESEIVTKSGKTKWLQTTLTPVINSSNEIDKFVIIDTDITKLKEAESNILQKNSEINDKAQMLSQQATDLIEINTELEKQKNKSEKALTKLQNAQSQLVAAEKMASLGQLTAGIAHEINNPITYISSSIEGLIGILDDVKLLIETYDNENGVSNSPTIAQVKKDIDYNDMLIGFDELTNNIKLGVDRTKEIVDSLRNFSRVDDDNYARIDINQSIKSAIILLGKAHRERISIETDLQKTPPVMCMPGKINQVLLNILVNAVQAIETEGCVKINSTTITKKNTEYVKISITDNGKGMSDDTKEKIFEPFFTTKDIGEGTGLGLSITYSIIKKHNGFIEIDSTVQIGTEFSIYIPINKA